ncbi:hypothetical protein F4823DRAFT_604915 [Ustulina deusta]|nr:hypothetical protein F4823DRAFT_604915 [Ustulina deusta]
MKFAYVALFVGMGSSFTAGEGNEHGQDAEGTVQGPVAFLWPEDRPWSAGTDNIGPCGSPDGVINRTNFPLSQGSVAITIADEAWNVAFSVAYADNPTIQSQFIQQVANVASVESGHQCYKIDDIPDTVVAGSNATIQLEYWSHIDNELGGSNQSFFACADITFVEPADFSIQVPCFNITSSDFDSPEPSSTATAGQPDDTGVTDNSTSNTSSSNSNEGLSTGAIAGIAVGVVVASLLVIGVVAFVVFRRRSIRTLDSQSQPHGTKVMTELVSVSSHRQ